MVAKPNGAGQQEAVSQPLPPAVPAEPDDKAIPVWTLIKPEAVMPLWPQVEPFVRSSVSWSPHLQKMEGAAHVRDRCVSGEYQVWLSHSEGAIKAVLVVAITQHSACKVVDIHYGAGDDMETWMPGFYDVMAADARAAGCRFVRVIGREGWAKPLKEFGFEKAANVYLLEL